MAWPNVYGLDISKFDRDAPTQTPKPTILLVHDAFHTSEHFEELATELMQAGYELRTPQLPSSTSTYQNDVFEADVQAVFDPGRIAIEAGRNVVLVMHGYGSLPASVAATRLNQHSLDRPRAGEVIKLVFVAGVIVEHGECYEDVLRPAWMADEVRTEPGRPAFGSARADPFLPSGRWSESCPNARPDLLSGLWTGKISQRR